MEAVVEVPFVVTITIAILCVFAGLGVNRQVPAFRRWNMPDVVVGGLIAAAATSLLQALLDVRIVYDLASRDTLLLYFFAGIGLNIRLSDVASGGKPVIVLLLLTAGLMILQNVIARAMGHWFPLPDGLEVLLGSLALSGGHGTAIAWGPILDQRFGLHNSLEIGVAVATLGLIAGSVLGGPVAHVLISRRGLRGSTDTAPMVGLPSASNNDEGEGNDISHYLLLRTVAVVHVAIALGWLLNKGIAALGLTVPLFVPTLLIAMALANLLPVLFPGVRWPSRTRALALVSDVSLSLFLALSLMSMQLAELVHVGVPILLVVAVQMLVVVIYIFALVFPLMGRDYDAAVISAGFTGIGLGSTATAFVNMSAVTSVHGSSVKAWITVSLVAALFLDLANSAIVAFLIR